MEEMLSFCGYRCDVCPAFERNLGSLDKKKLSDGYAKYFDYKVAPEEIQPCRGCLIEGDENCPVRPCAIERNMENCAHCPECVCETLEPKINAIENNIETVSCLSEEDYDLFVRPYESKRRLLETREHQKERK